MKFLKNNHQLSLTEKAFLVVVIVLIGIFGYLAWQSGKNKQASINSFAECAAAGNPIMESYSEQCSANNQTFTNADQSPIDDWVQ